MIYKCQKEAFDQLLLLKDSKRQSLLIEGPEGCGKTSLARQYSQLVEVPDFQVIQPKVDEVRQAVETCLSLNQSVVLCIENLDTGVPAASYALLKFLEEPLPNVYIVVTCRNIKYVPDTIISRATVVTVSPPIDSDIAQYATCKDPVNYNRVKDTTAWKCVRTFNDADKVLSMKSQELSYFDSLSELCNTSDSVSNIIWKLGHYDDNTETPLELVIRCVMNFANTSFVQHCGIECIRDLSQRRIAPHAILAKFAFNIKYCE